MRWLPCPIPWYSHVLEMIHGTYRVPDCVVCGLGAWAFTFPHFIDACAYKPLYNSDMTATDFCRWLEAMAYSGAEAARQLGVNANTVTRYRRQGGGRMLALACAALFHRLGERK